MSKKRKYIPYKKACPLLEKCGIKETNAHEGAQVCLQCELDRCVYDYAGQVTKEDKARLELFYCEKVKEEGESWWQL